MESLPYFWPDSFDWIDNGLYLLDHVFRGIPRDPPTIRQPLFSLIVAAAYALAEPKLIIVTIHLAWGVVLLATYLISRELRLSAFCSSLLLLAIATNHTLNSFRLYIMGDTICLALTLVATYYYIKSLNIEKSRLKFMVIAAACSGLAAVCQLYGLFPAIAYSVILIAVTMRDYLLVSGKRASLTLITLAIANIFLSLVPFAAWMIFKKIHFGSFAATQVSHFSLLELSLNNLKFYQHVWPILFAPVLIAALLAIPLFHYRKLPALLDQPLAFLLLLTCSFGTFTFFYQWEESRFTANYLPFAFIVGFLLIERLTGSDRRPKWLELIIGIAVVYTAAVPTGELMRPKVPEYFQRLASPTNFLSGNALVELSNSAHVNRKSDPCISSAENRLVANPSCDPYIYPKLVRYLNRSRAGVN